MKKMIAAAIGSLTLLANSLTASVCVKEIASWHPDEIEKFYRGELPETAVYFPKGSEFPLELLYSGDFFAISGNGGYRLTVTKDFFIQMIGNDQLVFSLDGENWKPILELTTGQMNLGLKWDESTLEPVVFVGGFLEERK